MKKKNKKIPFIGLQKILLKHMGTKEQKKQVLDELWEDLQSAIQFTRDRNNARRRAKRLAQKEKVW
mgnify:CR=1 FL=1